MEKFTWKELEALISNLTPEQKEKEVFIAIDDESTFRKVLTMETLQEDIWVNKDNEDDCGPLQYLKEIHGEDFIDEDYELSTHAGTPYMYSDKFSFALTQDEINELVTIKPHN